MINKYNFDDQDRRIMKLRALGYHQTTISKMLDMSQSTVSQRVENIRETTNGIKEENLDQLFWKILLGAGAVYLLSKLFEEK